MFNGTVPFVMYGMHLSLVGLFHSYDSEKLKQTLWKETNSRSYSFWAFHKLTILTQDSRTDFHEMAAT